MESSRSNQSVQPKSETLIKVINKIFKLKGDPRRVKNIGQDFADGSKFSLSDFTPCTTAIFLDLFNYIYDERIDLKLSTAGTLDAKVQNWNKINASICFNYLQQEFILIAATMTALAQGKKGAAAKVCVCLLQTIVGKQFELTLDTSCIEDIGQVLQTDMPAVSDSASERAEDRYISVTDKFDFQSSPFSKNKVCITDSDLKLTKQEKQIMVNNLSAQKM